MAGNKALPSMSSKKPHKRKWDVGSCCKLHVYFNPRLEDALTGSSAPPWPWHCTNLLEQSLPVDERPWEWKPPLQRVRRCRVNMELTVQHQLGIWNHAIQKWFSLSGRIRFLIYYYLPSTPSWSYLLLSNDPANLCGGILR